MIDGAVRLLATRGLEGTSFSDLLELTGAPRGSLYHHFPDGKEQLIAAAVDLAGERAAGQLDLWAGSAPERVTELFLGMWRELLTRSDMKAGCAVVAVTVSADSLDLLSHTAAVFRSWRGKLAGLLESGGLAAGAAAGFAATLVAASEGAVVLSRAERSMEPFELVATSLLAQARGLAPGR